MRKVKWLCWAAALFCFFFARTGFAQTAEFKAAPVGTRFEMSNGDVYEIASVTGHSITTLNIRSGSKDEWLGLALRGIRGSPDELMQSRVQADKIWPLQIGKVVKFSGASRGYPVEYEVNILRVEDLPTEAGTFRTFVIESVTRWNVGSNERLFTAWYAPDAGFIVRRKMKIVRGAGESEYDWVVKKITPPK